MADNTVLNVGSGGDVIAADDVGGIKHQRVKISVGDEGSAADVSSAEPLPVRLGDTAQNDAFSRLRVSEPTTIFESKLIMADKAPLLWDEQLESGASISGSTPTVAKPYIDFTSTVSVAGVYTRQTFRRLAYQPGKSQLVVMTGVLDLSGGGTGVQRRIGLFDDNNGLFFEDDEGTIKVVVRSNDSGTPVDTKVAQASWNVDPMDGTGPSGITADWAKSQIFMFDFQWLSTGRVRFYLDIGGVHRTIHEIVNTANESPLPYMSTPNLPLRYQIVTTGSSPASTMRVICSMVVSEGGEDPVAVPVSHATVAHVDANVADTIYALVGIRLLSTALGVTITPESISVLSETNDDFEWQLIFNPTVAGTFTYSGITNSACEGALGATANTITGGTVLQRGFGAQDFATAARAKAHVVKLGAAIDGTVDTMVLAARPLGTNADIQGALDWSEQR